MLESVIPFQNQLIKFCNSNNFPYELTDAYFENCIALSSFLFTFKEATEFLSRSYYPTLAKVGHIFSEFNEHPQYGSFINNMFEKYKKYYADILILYCMALCLNYQVKTCRFYSIIEYLYETLDFDETIILKQFRIKKYKNS
jgi:hypothetical protein